MQQYLYLAIDLGCLLIPFLFSFHPKLQFHKEWRAYLPAMIVSAILFLIWDELFTQQGIWGFNERYVTGIFIGNLPIEEILFFICIPYACVFTYHCLKRIVSNNPLQKSSRFWAQFLFTFSIAMAVINYNKLYTVTTFALLALFMAYIIYIKKHQHFADALFAYIAILPFFFISNGILTGSFIPDQVVWYNNTENFGRRIFTIPFEDAFYGFLLILLNIYIYEAIKQKFTKA